MADEVGSLVGKIKKEAMGSKTGRDKPKKQPLKGNQGSALAVNTPFRGGNILEQRFDEGLSYRPRTKENKLIYEMYLGRIHELVQDQPPETLASICDEVLAIVKSEGEDLNKKSECEALIGSKMSESAFIDLNNLLQALTDYQVEQEHEEKYIQLEQPEEQEEEEEEEEIMEVEEEEEIQENYTLDLDTVEGDWLVGQLKKYYSAEYVVQMEKQILLVLNHKSNLEVENALLSLLNYQCHELIKVLLENRMEIYYRVLYHQCEQEKEKEHLLQEMRVYNISLNRVSAVHEAIEAEEAVIRHIVKDEEIMRMNKKQIDLSTYAQNKALEYKLKLPEGAQKIERMGYEQVFVPARVARQGDKLIELDALPEWMHICFEDIKRLNAIQSKVYDYVLHDERNMLVCAPTSAGKTNLALLAILQVIGKFRDNGHIRLNEFKVVYIAPMKALVAEITGNLSNRLKGLGVSVKELTGDMHLSRGQIEDTQIIVSTPEKWDIITRKAGDRLFVEKVKLLIIDEIHLLSDPRGPVLESIIARTIRMVELRRQQTRIVGLSATLPNYKDVGAVLRAGKEGVFYFDQSYRPIPLEQRYIGITEKKGVRKLLMMNEILYEKVMERVANHQIIIFVHSRRDTARTAQSIYETALSKNELGRILKNTSQSKKILQMIVEKETINSKELKELLVHGIGIHHAGLSRADRDLVEQLFSDRHLNILVSTATLAWGVNLPAHTVIIKGTQVYSAEEGKWKELSLQDILQMLGRAGRPRFDQEGEGIIITGYEEVRYYLHLLNMSIPLESQMYASLPDQLNAEIVIGSVASIRDAVNWLSYTYLFIRMLKNPRHYGIPIEDDDKELLKRRVNIVHSVFTLLQRNGLINYDRKSNSVSPTFLGKTASYYYIKYPSIGIYNSNLKNTSGLIDLFKIFAMSAEFKYLLVREEEKNQLKKLLETVPVPIKGAAEDATTKIAALLQAHISKLPLEGFALNIDKVYVTQSASRIMRALFEICLKRNWGQATQKTLELAKMIDRAMWGCLNPLRQFKEIPEYVLSRLQKKEQFSWESFYQMSPQEIGDLTKFPKLGKILHKFVHHIPRVELHAQAQPLTRSCLKIELKVKADFKWQQMYHGKQQPFWLMVLDCNEESILYSCYFTLQKDSTYQNEFIVPLFEVMHPLYFIKVISDRWICTDNVLPLSFKNMVLPSKFSAPIELNDVQFMHTLLPIGKNLKISSLNAVQTQVYSRFVTSSQNIFLGASQNTGKFTMAIFAMVNILEENKKVLILAPNQQLQRHKYMLLNSTFPNKRVGHTFNDLSKDLLVLANSDIVVSTAEAWNTVSRRWKSRKGFDQIGLIIVLNIHMLSTTMEVVLSRMRSTEILFRIIALATSLADYREIAEWLGVPSDHAFNFHRSVRATPVEVIFHSNDQFIRESRVHTMEKQFIQAALHYNRSALAFVCDKKQACLTALNFVSELSLESNPKKLKKVADMQLFAKKISDQILMHVLEYGVGYIYEGMDEVEKQIIEKLFQIEGIGILVCSQGVKWGLSSNAFLVGVLDCTYFDCKASRWRHYDMTDMFQFMSFSQYKSREHQSSKFIVLCQSSHKAYYKKFLLQPYPLQSQLHNDLSDHLNAGIVSNSIQTKEDCIDWLTWTFLYRRLPHNPNYYGMEDTSQEGISAYLSQLIENAIDYLQNVKCVEQQPLSPTNLGLICTYYSLKVQTIALFSVKITPSMKQKEILQLVSLASELKQYSYRPKQYEAIAQMLVKYNEKPLNKCHGLMMLYLHRASLASNMVHDLNKILSLSVRLIYALVDILSTFGYLRSLIVCMRLCQMIVQGMWVDDSILLQIVDKETVAVLQTINITDLDGFLDMDEKERNEVLKNKNIDKIANACNRIPQMEMECRVGEVKEGQIQIVVKLTRNQEVKSYQIISQCYPHVKEESWWVVVGDKKNNKVLNSKKILVQNTAELVMNVQLQGAEKINIYGLCDSYIGSDVGEEISIPELNKEEKDKQMNE